MSPNSPYDTTPAQLARAHARNRIFIRLTFGSLTVICFVLGFIGGKLS